MSQNYVTFAAPTQETSFEEKKELEMEKIEKNILSLIQEATGNSDISSIDFKDLDSTTKDQIDFKRVRGSVRLMSGKIKTLSDVLLMKQAFLARPLP